MTDIEKVRDVAKTFLELDITEEMIYYDGLFISHPFFSSPVVYFPSEDKMLNILQSEEDLNKAKELYAKEIEESDVRRIFYLVNSSYQRTFFKHVKDYLSDSDYANIWRSIWRNTEFPSQDKNLTVPQMLKIFQKTKKEHLMSDAECEKLESMPEVITIYRGVDDKAYANKKALSWTEKKETAEFFSNRFGKGTGVVLEAKINKKDVLAYFGDSSEGELIVNYNKLMDVTY